MELIVIQDNKIFRKYIMGKYIFIKITNNNDVNEFDILYTKLRDYRTKISILKNQYVNYQSGIGKYKDIFDLISIDFSACCVHRGDFETKEELLAKVEELKSFYHSRLNKNI